MLTRRDTLKAAASLGAGALLGPWATRLALAQDKEFPSRTVKLITPFPPGSGPDAALRLVAEQLGKRWNQAVVVDNKAGGNGFIAVSEFKRANNDGHELLQLDNTHCTTHPHTFAHLPYHVEQDFTPLRMILRTQFFVAVGADSPFRTLDDIVAAARARPERVTYGSWFVGSPGHLGALRLQALTGVQMTHVPFRDFGQLYGAVATREVEWALGSAASAGALERAGKLRFIALAGPARDPLYPQVPATAESPTLKGFEVAGWTGLFAHARVAPEVRDRLSADIAAALAAPEVMERYRSLGYESPDIATTAFADLIRRETFSWSDTIRVAHLRLD
jgi:tripartite-type tricarboxylate transporter receptor subunit TctC